MNQLETRELAYFVTVAETLHFGQAAERLGITQPPLSRAIAQLERRVGVPLLKRTTRQVTLTAAGEVFLAECRTILAALDTAVRKARKAAVPQRVTVAVRPAAGPGILPDLLAVGARGPDGVLTEVVFTYDEIGALRDGTADVALMCQSVATPGSGLEVMELGLEEPVVLLPAGHPLADRPFLTLAEVEALPGYEAELPHEALDTMVDRVALGRLVVVVGDSVRDRLGGSVRAVPVYGYPPTQLVLAWLPDARPAASRLTATAHAVLDRRTRLPQVLEGTDLSGTGTRPFADGSQQDAQRAAAARALGAQVMAAERSTEIQRVDPAALVDSDRTAT
ncbi:LysR family transcriptional regulator [Streptomyces sp. WI04-05B]|uniref:LysR family transcriptional regulator n=1 Tax=Streptomyces TaxID=1883 RepID=UPI0029AF5A1A|nr:MULTISPECIES: LysR family transcriptional regulator [Streptomyces]MDX2548640.1 LysR family transcriptional regulator [Streptomyces sp. WI04-05B]MDX2589039.1 LysR family transcriptional regulator [Streptomyces sp. WI04-05A]MDX3746542.1 LysR family transcriptional regulator [Streptomyces sp. AK08-02]